MEFARLATPGARNPSPLVGTAYSPLDRGGRPGRRCSGSTSRPNLNYVAEGDAAARDAAFDGLLQQIGNALESDSTLGGLAFGLTYGRPEPSIEAVAGAPAIKSATLTVAVGYESDAPLS